MHAPLQVEMYSTQAAAITMVVGNKLDREDSRAVTRAEGQSFARSSGALFVETSAKSAMGVQEAFMELVQRVLETPVLLAESASSPAGLRMGGAQAAQSRSSSCCG